MNATLIPILDLCRYSDADVPTFIIINHHNAVVVTTRSIRQSPAANNGKKVTNAAHIVVCAVKVVTNKSIKKRGLFLQSQR